MKLLPRQKIWLAIVIVANAALWIVPNNVVELIARDEQTLLGRYSLTHFAWNVGILLLSILGCYIDWSRGARYKRRWFQVLAVAFFLVPTVVIADFFLRTPDVQHFIRGTPAYHRPPNAKFNLKYVDRPEALRTYPNAKPGFPTVDCELHTDANGYRNRSVATTYDIIALGDSFTEGSNVTDEQCWPAQWAKLSGKSVYNLGMSGYDPFHYLESYKEIGEGLRAKIVVCLVYEGNDFRSTKSDEKRLHPSVSMRFHDYVARSPVIKTLDRLLVDTFAPIGSHAVVANSAAIDWLPVAVTTDAGRNYYEFEPKQLRDLYESADDFMQDEHWLNPRGQLNELNMTCKKNGARLLIALAPAKAHVVLPLVADHLPIRAFRDFAAIGLKELPPANEFMKNLLSRLDAKETVIADWCASQSIGFISLTKPLRDATASGTQVYYSYDQHWSPAGHEVVARAINAAISTTESQVLGK
ncbi:MAG: SGNH/GDSL hydrolase family protein [Planctomycetes bacterium]|nr:SGNH/GDSL hydrolase family protein [Planctomycetota bacterium]MBI3835060.1 SGNH/GDSL hydrolase family protein [Planctomycetota bacterium]